MTAEIQHPVK